MLAAILAFSNCVTASTLTSNEPSDYLFDIWTTDNGLPQNSINAILQTKDGYLWLSTFDGLVRYDGIKFVIFNVRNTPGITSNRFTALLEDPSGNLWIGTEDAGVIRYQDGKFSSFLAEGKMEPVTGFQIDDAARLLIVTTHRRYKLNGSALASIAIAPDGTDENATFVGRQDFGYLTDAGFAVVHSGKPTTVSLSVNLIKEGIFSTYVDRQGTIWISTLANHLVALRGKSSSQYDVPSVYSVYEDREGSVWFGTSDNQLLKYTNGVFKTYSDVARSLNTRISAIYEDAEGTIWLGTGNRGLCRLRKKIVTPYSRELGITVPVVYPVYADQAGVVWLGGRELVRVKDGVFTPSPFKVVNPPSDPHKRFVSPTSLFEDTDGRLWIGTDGGVYSLEDGKLSDQSDRVGYKRGSVNVVYQDRERDIWFGLAHGLIQYKDGFSRTYGTEDGLAGEDIKAIIEDRHGAVWIGSYGGLSHLKDGRFTSYTERDGLASNRVRSLYEDAEGIIWIGTYDGGLCRFKNGKFTTYNTKNGLFNNGVFQILEDSRGSFWMSCNRGIYRVSKQELNDFADGKIRWINCVSYGKEDGMLNTECNGGRQPAGARTPDGKLWFPTQDGVAVIDPNSVPINTLQPPVHIENVLLDRENIDFGGAITVRPGQENLEIDYTAPAFVKPEQVRFRYLLQGVDKDWVEAGDRRVANYSHIQPGSYTFQVIAANSDGVWNNVGASIRITVLPPFYRTWWFLSLVTMSAVAIALLAYRQRMLQLQRRHQVQQAFSQQLIESQEGERKRISAELHDSIGQSLVVIKNLAFMAANPEDNHQAQERVAQISAVASQAITEVKEISYNLRPYQLDRLGLSRAIKALIDSVANSSEIKFEISIDDLTGLFSKEAEINLYRIIQEGLSNIIKHSGATEARISIKRQSGGTVVTMQDNGRGFVQQRPESKDGGFGLIGLAERVRMLGGKHIIQSAPGQGTVITINIGHENSDGQRN